jgi:hypothetical protein
MSYANIRCFVGFGSFGDFGEVVGGELARGFRQHERPATLYRDSTST